MPILRGDAGISSIARLRERDDMIDHLQDSPRIEFMKVETVAAELHQTREHVIYLLRQGRLPGVKLGRKWLIPKVEFRRYLYDLLQKTLGAQK